MTGLGATVVLLHHTGKGENTKDYRGSSDIKASLDVGLVLTAKKPNLQLLRLKPFKVREGQIDPLSITFVENKPQLVAEGYVTATDPDWQRIRAVVEVTPGLSQTDIIKALPEMAPTKIRRMLLVGLSTGQLRMEKGAKNASLFYWGAGRDAQ